MSDWNPTHKITFTPTGAGAATVYLVTLDDGVAYTEQEWVSCEAADWEVVEGTWLFQGQATPGGACGVVTVEKL